jgi:hypothetical protein
VSKKNKFLERINPDPLHISDALWAAELRRRELVKTFRRRQNVERSKIDQSRTKGSSEKC